MNLEHWKEKLYHTIDQITELLRDFGYSIKKTARFVEKLVDYIPVLWRDRDWDICDAEVLLMHKLKRMANVIEDAGYREGNRRVARQIRYAIYLQNRIRSEYDLIREYSAFEEKWGKVEWPRQQPNGVIGWHFSKATSAESSEKAIEEYRLMTKRIFMKEDELYARLWRHLGKYWRGWWD